MKKLLSLKIFRLIFSIAVALVAYLTCPPCFSKTTLIVILAIMLLIVNAAEFIAKFTWLTHIARILVGGLFIFSGFIKANDPLGFSYKLEEYFEVFKGDTGLSLFEWFAHISLPIAIIICAAEMILGFLLLLGYKRRLTLNLLLAQILFFTFLTFYSACYNKVTHCGCFGDFLPLKPWESFLERYCAFNSYYTVVFRKRKYQSHIFTHGFKHFVYVGNSFILLVPDLCIQKFTAIGFSRL